MKKLYDTLEIEKWIEIAKKINDLEIKKDNRDDNIEVLKNTLKTIGIDNYEGCKYPLAKSDIGIHTLLQQIYNHPFGKKEFINSIAALHSLKIKNIKYCPINFEEIAYIKPQLKIKPAHWVEDRIYTDGTFKLCKNGDNSYLMKEIRDASFLLKIKIKTDKKHVSLLESFILIKNFDKSYILPHRNSILSTHHPNLIIEQKQYLNWGEIPRVKQSYSTIDYSDKRFIKSYKSIIKG